MAALRIALAAMLLLGASSLAQAGGGPENVFLVVNSRGAKSKEIANHYIALRRIPPINVYYVPAPVEAPNMTGEDFREKILAPILSEIEKRRLRPQIDYIVYSCEFPWRVDCATLLGLPNESSPNRPSASLTGATYLYQFVMQANAGLPQFNTNFYCVAGEMGPSSTRAFRSTYQWSPGGERVNQGGLSYLLSAQLGCLQVEGNTVDEIKSYLERAAGARRGRVAAGQRFFAAGFRLAGDFLAGAFSAAGFFAALAAPFFSYLGS